MHIKDLFSLEGKTAVVVGGYGKIGYPMSEALAEAGADVFIASPSAEKRSNALNNIQTIQMNQADEEDVERVLHEVTIQSRVPSILINSGVERPMKNFFDDTVATWDRSMEVNARGLFVTCRAFGRAMAKSGGGSIINIASIYGLVAPDQSLYEGTDFQTEPDYPYTKGGMIMFSKYLASFFAKQNVRVNCVAPGGFFNHQPSVFLEKYNRKTPIGRMANHDDLKGVAVFLASEASRYVTGVVIPVDGGFTMI